jgi:PTS system sucrose-specific IIC component
MKDKIDKDTVEDIEKVQGAFFNSGQYQIIFGTGTVNKIYDEVVALGLPTATTGEQKAEAAKQGNAFSTCESVLSVTFLFQSFLQL